MQTRDDDVGPGRPFGGRGRRTAGFQVRIGPLATAVSLALLAVGFAAILTRQENRDGGLRLLSGSEIWLLTVFVAAVLALLFGASAWLGMAVRGRGAREALESLRAQADEVDRHGSAGSAGDGDRGVVNGSSLSREGAGTSPGWIMEVGGWLALVYVAGWLVLG